jgi:uncharacterized SAM-binding protein YcdF (DUF218 family)
MNCSVSSRYHGGYGIRNPAAQRGGIIVKLVFLLFLVALCAAIYFARHPLLRFTAESWVVEDPIEHADAIFVLTDDNFYADRATRAAELFRQDYAPLVVASGRRLRPSAGISELMEHDLIERGVPKEKILRLPHDATDIRGEAEKSAAFAAGRNWRKVLLVTSNYRTRRTRYIFRRIFPTDIEVRVASARDGDFDPAKWWLNGESIDQLTQEMIGMVVACWELRGKPGA